jgi:hypothetical protein
VLRFEKPGWRLGGGPGPGFGFALFLAALVRVTAAALLEPSMVRLESVPEQGLQPQVKVDGHGRAHLVFLRPAGDAAHADVRYSKREPGESAWSEPMTVNTVPGAAIAVGTIRGPQLALGAADQVHICWNGSDRARPKPAQGGVPLLYTRLNDARTAFEPERDLLGRTRYLDGGAAVAADLAGHVWLFWHAAEPGGAGGETNRAVYLAASHDHGHDFAVERRVSPPNSGACACCGLQAGADEAGRLVVWYRAATTSDQRPGTLLFSLDHGQNFVTALQDEWAMNQCPMSSASLMLEPVVGSGPGAGLAAWETAGRVRWTRWTAALLGETTSIPPSSVRSVASERPAKHPVLAANRRGEILIAWTEGTGWQRGGNFSWQVVDAQGAVRTSGRSDGVPIWGSLAAYAEANGTFRLLH